MTTFEGFEPANTTPVPDILFDELLFELSGSELKVLLYIIRRTVGFKKTSDAISLKQFQKGIKTRDGKVLDKGCGISDRQTIVNALESLEKKKCIKSAKSNTISGDKDVTRYCIHFKEVVGKPNQGSRENQPRSMTNPTTVVGNSNQGSMTNPTRVVGKTNPQETVLQDTDSQQTDSQECNSDVESPQQPPEAIASHTHTFSSYSNSSSVSPEEEKTTALHSSERVESPDAPTQGNLPVLQEIQQNVALNETPQVRQHTNSEGIITQEKPKARTTRRETQPPVKLLPPQMPPADMAWGTKKCLMLFDAWRGSLLIAKYKIMEASTCAKGLAAQYTEEQITKVYERMSASSFWQEKGGPDIVNVANNIAKEIKKIKPIQPQPTHADPIRGSLDKEQAEALATKAIRLASVVHPIQATPSEMGASWGITVNWNTAGFPPELFGSEAEFSHELATMCDMWLEDSKKKQRVS